MHLLLLSDRIFFIIYCYCLIVYFLIIFVCLFIFLVLVCCFCLFVYSCCLSLYIVSALSLSVYTSIVLFYNNVDTFVLLKYCSCLFFIITSVYLVQFCPFIVSNLSVLVSDVLVNLIILSWSCLSICIIFLYFIDL